MGGGRLSATPTSTALTLRVKVWYGTGRVYTAVLYVERSGQLRLCLTPHPPVQLGKSNLVNTTVDGQIPIGEGDHI